MPKPEEVPARVCKLASEIVESRPMRRGSLVERLVRCGKPGCACAERPEARHGPYFSLTRVVGGRTRTRLLSAAQAGRAQEQIDADRQFRKQVDTYREACEEWADAELEAAGATSPEGEEKGGSRKRSKRRSPRRSRSS
jgi:hypothetical protein